MPKLDDTKYPIQPGNIIRLKSVLRKYNKKLKMHDVAHEVFIWILSVVKDVGGPRGLHQSARVAIYYLPLLNGLDENYILDKKIMKKRSVVKKLTKYDYELVGKSVFNGTPDCWIRTREIIHLK